jgi:ADP-glucose pyrophosphorylase
MTSTENKKYTILQNDYLDIKHPITRKTVRLYRILSLMEFTNPHCGIVPIHSTGGFVESEKNLSYTDSSWILNTAKVFDEARAESNTLVKEQAAIFENANVDNSIVSGYSRVYGRATVKDSIVSDKVNIHGFVSVKNSTVENGSIVNGGARVSRCIISDGCFVHGDAMLENCMLSDTVELFGNVSLINCTADGRYIGKEGKFTNSHLGRDIELNVTSGKSEA